MRGSRPWIRPRVLQGTTLLATAALASVLLGGSSLAQEATPSVTPPTVSGSVTGSPAVGGHLTVRISALDVRGWRSLAELDIEVLSGGVVVDELRYDVANDALDMGIQRVKIGTGSSGSSEHFRVSGAQVIVTTGGGRLVFSARLEVLSALPEDARFRLTALDYDGRGGSVTRSIAARSSSGGFDWSTVAVAVAAALFIGGFIGNLLASRRRPVPRLSVYAAVQRRIDEGGTPRATSRGSEGTR